ncbi:hypothetical protein PTW35_09005 [Photobacterium sp. DA100]|uniref:hypothetical protein n=1 Tax=Photobacterium sp. DA100 TaxID=3027472 RepID=UPI002478E583|nr:hypothetical protein [Photobacterium sp. DA100]WEM43895.1 hypothetical protein PTW35_09005 [Photobacterium sp. DA100]
MRRKHEQSVVDAFSNQFARQATDRGRAMSRCSLDGQDSILGADYIFTTTTNFALVEFKYEERDIRAEGNKSLRERLCLLLDDDVSRRSQSLKCHYIAWSKKRQQRSVVFNKYYPEVCNKNIFPQALQMVQDEGDITSRQNANEVIDKFLNGEIGSNYYTFKQYTNWLLSIGGHEGSTVEVMLDNPDSDQLEILDFPSLELMKNWLDHNRPNRSVTYSTPSP